jgi:hypothetical protein
MQNFKEHSQRKTSARIQAGVVENAKNNMGATAK